MATYVNPVDEPGPRTVFVNQAFEHMTGYLADEVLGSSLRPLDFDGRDRAERDRIRQAMKAGNAGEDGVGLAREPYNRKKGAALG